MSPLSPFEKEHDLPFEQTWFQFTEGCFVPCWVEINLVFLENKFITRYTLSPNFTTLLLSPFGKGVVLQLNPLHSRMLSAKFSSYYWLRGSGCIFPLAIISSKKKKECDPDFVHFNTIFHNSHPICIWNHANSLIEIQNLKFMCKLFASKTWKLCYVITLFWMSSLMQQTPVCF